MTEKFDDLAEALRERLRIIGDEESRQDSAAHMQRLQRISARIEEIEQQLPPEIDPKLRHYLQRRSYDKTLEFLSANTTRRSTAR